MTYSQRSTHSAASSDYTYLEYQLGLAGDELKRAEQSFEASEAELNLLQSSSTNDPVKSASEEERLREQAAMQQAVIEAIRGMIAGLEEELAKLEDE